MYKYSYLLTYLLGYQYTTVRVLIESLTSPLHWLSDAVGQLVIRFLSGEGHGPSRGGKGYPLPTPNQAFWIDHSCVPWNSRQIYAAVLVPRFVH